MIRVVVQSVDDGPAANIGGPVLTSFKTFDIENAPLEAFLKPPSQWVHRQVIGVEVVERSEA